MQNIEKMQIKQFNKLYNLCFVNCNCYFRPAVSIGYAMLHNIIEFLEMVPLDNGTQVLDKSSVQTI